MNRNIKYINTETSLAMHMMLIQHVNYTHNMHLPTNKYQITFKYKCITYSMKRKHQCNSLVKTKLLFTQQICVLSWYLLLQLIYYISTRQMLNHHIKTDLTCEIMFLLSVSWHQHCAYGAHDAHSTLYLFILFMCTVVLMVPKQWR